MSTIVELSKLRLDGGTQPRAAIDDATVEDYADDMARGDVFPDVIAYFDGTDYWLADGFHRVAAVAKLAMHDEPASIACDVRQGTRRDAVLHSAGANASHGKRRTNADKRRAVLVLLSDQEWVSWSNREIARRCGVDEGLVRKLRDEMSADKPQTERTVQRGGATFTMQTGNIGKTPATELVAGYKTGKFYVFDKELKLALDKPFDTHSAARSEYTSLSRYIVERGEKSMNSSYRLVQYDEWALASDEYMKRDPDRAARQQFDPTQWYAFDHKLEIAIFFPYLSQLIAQSNYPDQERYTVAKGHYFAQHSNYRVISRYEHDKLIKDIGKTSSLGEGDYLPGWYVHDIGTWLVFGPFRDEGGAQDHIQKLHAAYPQVRYAKSLFVRSSLEASEIKGTRLATQMEWIKEMAGVGNEVAGLTVDADEAGDYPGNTDVDDETETGGAEMPFGEALDTDDEVASKDVPAWFDALELNETMRLASFIVKLADNFYNSELEQLSGADWHVLHTAWLAVEGKWS